MFVRAEVTVPIMNKAADPDMDAVERFKQGDARAFEWLFRKYQTYVYNIGYSILGNSEDAGDLVQESFLSVHRSIKTFNRRSAFSTWLYKIAYNQSITLLRKRRGHVSLEDIQEEGFEPQDGESVEAIVQARDAQAEIHRVLETLPPDYRAVLALRHFQDLSYEEIAEVVGASVAAIKIRLHRARKMFKDQYERLQAGG
ncbi:MAG: RNA polymerase sigma factor [Armatimonadetes bacterium]|nr:RNA polymerase sigma factor [Armatimonadota bacterium]